MPDPRLTEIKKLIADYEAADKDMTEANVEAAFVARLFAILGWATDDPTVWNRQVFARRGFRRCGLADSERAGAVRGGQALRQAERACQGGAGRPVR